MQKRKKVPLKSMKIDQTSHLKKRGARKRIHVLNNRQRSITSAPSIGIIKQTLTNWSILKRAKPNYSEKKEVHYAAQMN